MCVSQFELNLYIDYPHIYTHALYIRKFQNIYYPCWIPGSYGSKNWTVLIRFHVYLKYMRTRVVNIFALIHVLLNTRVHVYQNTGAHGS